jgi:hypothetical protein
VQVVALVPSAGAGAAAEHGGDAGVERLLHELRADPVDVAVDPAGGEDAALAGDDLRAGADDDVDAGLDVGVAGLADGVDAAVAQGHVGLDDAPVVQDQRVGDDGVDGALRARDLGLAHAVADHLAAAELDLLAVDRAVLLDLDDQVGVGEAHAVADGGAVHGGVGRARHAERHCSGLQLAADEGVEAVHDPPAGVGDEGDVAACPARSGRRCRRGCRAGSRGPARGRRTAPGSFRRNGSASRPGWAVAGVGDGEGDGGAAGVELDVAGGGEEFAGDHACGAPK